MNVVITGGHSGIGLELAKRLATDGHRLGFVVRSESRLDAVPGTVTGSAGFTAWTADLSVQADVAAVAEAIHEDWGHVDVLYNNAGVLLPELRRSAAGRELHFEVNTLAPVALMRGLEASLTAAAAPVVVNTVTGNMHDTALDLSQLTDPTDFRKLFGQYLQSKVALTRWMNALAREPRWSGVAVRSVNPGANKTGMTASDGVPWYIRMVRGLLFSAPTKGANLLYDAVFDGAHGRDTGVFLDERAVRVVPALSSADRAVLEATLAEGQPPGRGSTTDPR